MTIETALPAPNGVAVARETSARLDYSAAVDAEIRMRKGAGEPGALWLEELAPVYCAGMSPEVAAARILERRGHRAKPEPTGRRRRGPVKVLIDLWREWDFRRSLRATGRA
jgi:hypothetical protein